MDMNRDSIAKALRINTLTVRELSRIRDLPKFTCQSASSGRAAWHRFPGSGSEAVQATMQASIGLASLPG
ncbi:MAG: hypothetical protein WStaBPW_34830 [Shewanella algae]